MLFIMPSKTDPLKRDLLKMVKSFDHMGIYARELNGEHTVQHKADDVFVTCSCYKVITALAVYQKLERKGETDNLILDFTERHRIGGSGILRDLIPRPDCVYNFLVFMLKPSDNTATNVLEQFVTMEGQREVVRQLGLEKTKLRMNIAECCYEDPGLTHSYTPETLDEMLIETNAIPEPNSPSSDIHQSNVSTPRELTRVLQELIRPTLIRPENAQKIRHIMSRWGDPDDIIAEYGRYIEMERKGGWMIGIRADMNIVHSDNPFYLVTMASNLSNPERCRLVNDYPKLVNLAIDYFDSLAP